MGKIDGQGELPAIAVYSRLNRSSQLLKIDKNRERDYNGVVPSRHYIIRGAKAPKRSRQMKRSVRLWLGTLVLALIFGIMLTGCPQPTGGSGSDPTYSVWTRRGNATDAPTFQDGYYYTRVLTDNEFNTEVNTPFYQNAAKHNWTESDLTSYFTGLGFSNDAVNDVMTKIINNRHIEIGSREGAYIDWLLK
jgi:hypothetical protein